MQRKELTEVLLELLEQETGETWPHVTEEANLRDDLKLDSVDLVSLVLRIETRLKVQIHSGELEDIAKVGDLLDMLQGKLSGGAKRNAA